MRTIKDKRLHELPKAIMDAQPTKDAQAKYDYYHNWVVPFMDYLENELDDRLPYPADVPDIQPMYEYRVYLQNLKDRFASIGMDAILDVSAFFQKLNDMASDYYDHKKWYKDTAYKLRKRYYSPLALNKNGEDVSNPHQTTLDSLKSKYKNNNTF